MGWSGDTPIRTRDSRLTISPFCHGLLGDTNEVALRLEFDRTFVPAQLPHLDNPDTRALGVRVLGVYLAGATTAQRGDL